MKFGWYDYGARFYDPQIGRWHTMDPASETYYSWSTYQYVRNNPINRIDPNGMNDYGYTIDNDGRIEKVDNTGVDQNGKNQFDVLYRKDEYLKGNKEYSNTNFQQGKNGLRINDCAILSSLSNLPDAKDVNQATTGLSSINDMLKTFKYSADNSLKEWSYTRYYNEKGSQNITIGTSHMNAVTREFSYYGISNSNVITDWHSHSDDPPSAEISSMGYSTTGFGGSGTSLSDKDRVYNFSHENNGIEPFPTQVYFPISGNYYHLYYKKPVLIGSARKY
ncbi:MAG: RHS repeat-associated core domain-containing protein [Bacteroidales bacterium]|nr:RHS repeat-associated core domain-containing protein [Bacteroidales bacterium]MCB8999528.1 RHS repeat-associated core domain-containing protein [Bacteroidales bacterium]MCB9012949.1 RHS repeat-associated core domain-containing protein [Bacteroidales bacterium]